MVRKAKTNAPSQRMLRVGELVRHALSTALMRADIQDEALFDVAITVPEVRMTPDLRLANAYIMPLGGGDADNVVEALNRHKKYIRGQIVSSLSLKYAPELRFYIDETFDEVDRIDALLRSDHVARDTASSDPALTDISDPE